MHHRNYIHQNPVARKSVNDPREYRYSSAFPGFKLDSWPSAAKAELLEGPQLARVELVPFPVSPITQFSE